MPGGDRSGPMGFGPMTGRAAGYCAGFGMPGYMNLIPGRGWGFGRGRGFGRGWGWGFWGQTAAARGRPAPVQPFPPWAPPPPISAQEEITALKAQVEALRNTIDQINARIREIEQDEVTEGQT